MSRLVCWIVSLAILSFAVPVFSADCLYVPRKFNEDGSTYSVIQRVNLETGDTQIVSGHSMYASSVARSPKYLDADGTLYFLAYEGEELTAYKLIPGSHEVVSLASLEVSDFSASGTFQRINADELVCGPVLINLSDFTVKVAATSGVWHWEPGTRDVYSVDENAEPGVDRVRIRNLDTAEESNGPVLPEWSGTGQVESYYGIQPLGEGMYYLNFRVVHIALWVPTGYLLKIEGGEFVEVASMAGGPVVYTGTDRFIVSETSSLNGATLYEGEFAAYSKDDGSELESASLYDNTSMRDSQWSPSSDGFIVFFAASVGALDDGSVADVIRVDQVTSQFAKTEIEVKLYQPAVGQYVRGNGPPLSDERCYLGVTSDGETIIQYDKDYKVMAIDIATGDRRMITRFGDHNSVDPVAVIAPEIPLLRTDAPSPREILNHLEGNRQISEDGYAITDRNLDLNLDSGDLSKRLDEINVK